MHTEEIKACEIVVKGLVQGVGFRPHVFRLAKYSGLTGRVENRTDGVGIKVQGDPRDIEQFIFALKNRPPKLARIESVSCVDTYVEALQTFEISANNDITNKSTLVSPDVAVCDECLNDIKIQPGRMGYPFVNCVNCGPRFSIIKALPYDRANTTMDKFIMCDHCLKEYTNPENRRFHAQPNVCINCGPQYSFIYKDEIVNNIEDAIMHACELLKVGKMLAIKGSGGFHIVCDAQNVEAVKRLRSKKKRKNKPFAILMPDIKTIKKFATLNRREEALLLSDQRPIVLLEIREKFASGISPGINRVGVMLQYTPLHHLIFETGSFEALVFTSGNSINSPIISDNNEAQKELNQIVDAFLIYNREIFNRNDDSVALVVNSKSRMIRRSRGFAPDPVHLDFDVEGIIGTGAELKNCFCVGKGNMAILSQHIGDLKNVETFEFYKNTIDRFNSMFNVKPELIAHDRHPDYLSTRYAENSGIETVGIQHHRAHVASCMVENGIYSDVIGVCFDGLGFGEDGNIWGGEFFVVKDLTEFSRFTFIDYVKMPGGDKAINEPLRMAISYLYKVYGNDFRQLNLPILNEISKEKIKILISLIDTNVNSPLTSSAGRLFDAVSAIMNICTVSTYEGEAPMRMEALVDKNVIGKYGYEINDTINVNNVIKGVVQDMLNRVPVPHISAKFHNTIVFIIKDVLLKIRNETGLNVVALSGGVFQNSYILEMSETLLQKSNFEVYTHSKVPSNDGGIALGQLAIAAKKRSLQCV